MGIYSPSLRHKKVLRFRIPEDWTIIDKYFFGKPVKVEGEIENHIEQVLWKRVEWYKRMGYKVKIL